MKLYRSKQLRIRYRNLFKKYSEFLSQHRGLRPETGFERTLFIERFLLNCQRENIDLKSVDAEYIYRYLANTLKLKKRASKKNIVTALRSFFKYLYLSGYTKNKLDEAIPKINFYRNESLPYYLSKMEVQRLLKAPNQRTECGRRDYAILLLMASYGVRLCSVKTLKLKDIDWKKQIINFQSVKSSRPFTMPLLPVVAEALLKYIKRDRSQSSLEEVFLRIVKRGSGGNTHAQKNLVKNYRFSHLKSYYKKAGISSPRRGCHILRHSFATHLLQDGHTIKEISDLLVHQNIESTYLYTKVDVEQLRSIAVHWPEAV